MIETVVLAITKGTVSVSVLGEGVTVREEYQRDVKGTLQCIAGDFREEAALKGEFALWHELNLLVELADFVGLTLDEKEITR